MSGSCQPLLNIGVSREHGCTVRYPSLAVPPNVIDKL